MRKLDELLRELEATHASEVTIEMVFGHTVNTTGQSPGPQSHPYGARRGGISLLITKDEALLLRVKLSLIHI